MLELIVLILLLLWFIKIQTKSLLPPGPLPWPVFGNIFSLNPQNVAQSMFNLSKIHGPVMKLEMLGNKTVVVITDYKIMKECLTRSGQNFSGRLSSKLFWAVRDHPGLIFSEFGESWIAHRKFASATLRQFGVGKQTIEHKILEELNFIRSEIFAHRNEPFSVKMLVHHSAASVMYNILAGESLPRSCPLSPYCDSPVQEWNDFMEKHSSRLAAIRLCYPLRLLPRFRKTFKIYKCLNAQMKKEIKKVIAEHQAIFDGMNCRDFIDKYLMEIEKGTRGSIFNLGQLTQVIYDFFLAGNETTAQTIQWCLIALVHNQPQQELVFTEIRQVIGNHLPRVSHLESMPFTRALIEEIHRFKNIVPFTARKTIKEVEIAGYKIPPNTPVILNLWGIHFNVETFQQPEKFNPFRFIGKDGRFVKNENVVPFSLGARDCNGQQLARAEVFIFLCGIIQKFKVSPVADAPPPSLESGVYNLTNTPSKFQLIFTER